MAKLNTLYMVENSSRRTVIGTVPMRFLGTSLSIDVLGSETPPSALSDMTTIAPDDTPFTNDGWYDFNSLPAYIAFTGTADTIEVGNCRLVEKNAIS